MRRSLFVAVLFTALGAAAQEGGRTDGPEGSEQGKGGYEKPSGSGRISILVNWGASVPVGQTPPLGGNGFTGAPLYLGGTLSFWMYDWFLLDAHGSYALNTGRTNILVGPRFRTSTWPVAASLGLRAGAILDPQIGVRFGLSPIATVEMIFIKHIVVGLEGSFDIPISGNGSSLRVGLMLGWRF
jgi:hypothetical protein